MSQKMKHFILAGAAVLTLGVGASAAATASVHARGGDHHEQHQQGIHSHDTWRTIHYIKKNFDEIKQSGPVLHEHTALGTAFLKAHLSPAPDQAAVTTALDNNSQHLAASINKLYPGTEAEFLSLWRQHVQFSLDYLNASLSSDVAAQTTAKTKLQEVNDKIADLLENSSSKLDKNKLLEQLKAHSDGTVVTIDAMVAGDWTKVYAESHAGFEDMTELSITLLMGAKFKM